MTEQMQDTQECTVMAGPGAEHAKLEPFVGTFRAEVKLWMGPGDPQVMTGTMVNDWELGGRFLRQVYEGDPMEGPWGTFQGRGYWGYNTTDQRYEGFWIDTACTMMQTEQGQVDGTGKVWTMIGEMTNPESDAPMKKKSVITLKDKNHHTMEMYFIGPDGSEMKGMEIQYERTK